MKEATGELNMTVITIVAISAIGALLWFLWDDIEASIRNAWGAGTTSCPETQRWDPNTQSCIPR